MVIWSSLYKYLYRRKKSKEKIEIDIPCDGVEKEAYLQAMGMAYDRKTKKDCLDSLEFIACW